MLALSALHIVSTIHFYKLALLVPTLLVLPAPPDLFYRWIQVYVVSVMFWTELRKLHMEVLIMSSQRIAR